MKRIYILSIITLFLLSCTAFAQKSEFKNEKYNAGHIKNIILLCGIPQQTAPYVYDQYLPQTFPDVIIKEFSSNKDIKITNFEDIVHKINLENNCDIMEMFQTNPTQANQILQNYTSKYDAYLIVNILQYGNGSQYRPAFSYNTTQYQTGSVIGSDGSTATVTVPQTVTNTIPAGTISNATAAIEFIFRDTKTNETIFARTESRTRASDAWNTADPKDIAKRISDNYINDVLDKIAKDSKKISFKGCD